jgi:hypothetical protein
VSEDDRPREEGENATQRRMDEEGAEGKPVDVDWEDAEGAPHEGEHGQEIA